MKTGCLVAVLTIIFGAFPLHAEQLSLNQVLNQMKRDLKLSDEQVEGIRPIIQLSMNNRQAFFHSMGDDVIVDKKAFRVQMLKLRNEENQQLSKVLSQDQMNKLIEKQHMRDSLNKDQIDFSEGHNSGALNLDGATMSF